MDDVTFRPKGDQHIRELIGQALENGTRTATVTGAWIIESEIRVPSNFTLILDGCHLKMADGVYSNLLVNEHHDTDLGRSLEGVDRSIRILGKNGAILDGGLYNGLSEKTQRKNGLPPIWKNNLLLFTNVDGFEISGISFHNQRWWALNFIFCANGSLHDLDFKASDIRIDEQGNLHHGLRRDKYGEILVKNADGIDLRRGCHDIRIENVTGFTEDDSIALTGVYGRMEQTFEVPGLPDDICHITIKNVATSSFCTNVRLLSQGGVRLHDILIDGVRDTSEDSPFMDRGIYAVRVGDQHMYGTRHATADETYRITIKNVYSRAAHSAIYLAGEMTGLVIENVSCASETPPLIDLRGK